MTDQPAEQGPARVAVSILNGTLTGRCRAEDPPPARRADGPAAPRSMPSPPKRGSIFNRRQGVNSRLALTCRRLNAEANSVRATNLLAEPHDHVTKVRSAFATHPSRGRLILTSFLAATISRIGRPRLVPLRLQRFSSRPADRQGKEQDALPIATSRCRDVSRVPGATLGWRSSGSIASTIASAVRAPTMGAGSPRRGSPAHPQPA
jgi:hypothetical protein